MANKIVFDFSEHNTFSKSDWDKMKTMYDEGKLHGLPLNRSVCNHDNGEIIDIIAGNFFIVGTPMDSDSFQPLSEELQRKYEKMFHYPERFTEQYGRISAEKYKPVSRDQER